MTRTYDTQQEAATRKVTVKAYDFRRKPIFESYPQRDIASVSATSLGTRTSYDALGRTTRVEADLLATIATNYLGRVQTRSLSLALIHTAA